MAEFGVTNAGFVVKGLDVILRESQMRARAVFGPDIDLSSTSVLQKLLEVDAAEKGELWKRLEDLYYSNWISTAQGDSLDLLGHDVGVARRRLFSRGEVTFRINNPSPTRNYMLPAGTIVVTATDTSFHTEASIVLNAGASTGSVAAVAFDRGTGGDIAAAAIIGIDAAFAQFHLNLGAAVTLEATNPKPFEGGHKEEDDETYRARLIALPRTLWTVDSLRRAVLDIDGVIDVMLFDPLGGADVSQNRFDLFRFAERVFNADRRIGEPYFFDIIVAHEFARPWRTLGGVKGILERASEVADQFRPIGIYPNIVQANHIDVGFDAQIVIQPGSDARSIPDAIRERVADDIGALKLGGDVLFSQVMRACVEHPAVLDVRKLRLRRAPASFGRISFGAVPHQSALVEAAPGENLILAATEIAIMKVDSPLIDMEVVER